MSTTTTPTPAAPGPQSRRPLRGNLPEFRQDRFNYLLHLHQEYGDVVRFQLGKRPVYLVAHPDDVLRVLGRNSDNYEKGQNYQVLAKFLGRSVLITEGDEWKRQRRTMNPHFRRTSLNSFADMMVETTAALLTRWEAYADSGEPIDVVSEMIGLTLSIVCKALFQIDISGEMSELGQALTTVLNYGTQRTESFLAQFIGFLNKLPTAENRQYQAARATLDAAIYRMIDERLRGENQGDLLSALIFAKDDETGTGMDDEELRDQIMTLFIAGHETTANALCWVFYLLSMHPESERRLHAELTQALGDRYPTPADMDSTTYCQYVIEEAMRIYPPVPIFGRRAIGDDVLGGYHIPADSSIVLSQYVTHRHPAFWENPEGFDPERFTPARAEGRPHFAYFPFGGGPRRCIGDNFATLEMRLVIPMIVQKYQLALVSGHPVKPASLLTLRPENGLHMTIHRRASPER
ncbi:MAG: cytochrome P450 [Caldilineaceae bacterium]|nr:cytochrome P450 [Caldilineaceae bacterium]